MTPPDSIRRIVVGEAQVPFVRGGAELHVQALIDELARRGYEVEKVALPFRSQPKSDLLSQAAAWRLLDLSSSNGRPIDLFIATRFPTYFGRHPRKVAWVIHQHRAAYELCGTEYSDFEHTEMDVGLRAAARGSGRPHARRVPSCLRQRPQHRQSPREVQRRDRHSALPPAAARARAGAGRIRRLRAGGGPARGRQARGPGDPRGRAVARAGTAGGRRRWLDTKAARARRG